MKPQRNKLGIMNLNNLVAYYRKGEANPAALRELINGARTEHESTQNIRLIFETSADLDDQVGARKIRNQLLEIEAGWCEIADLLEERLAFIVEELSA